MSYASIIAKYRAPAIGGCGIDTDRLAGFVASHYRYFRNRRGMGAEAALRAAYSMPAVYTEGREYYGPTGGAGAPREGMRWIEDSAAMGFRFVGDACDLYGYGRGLPTGYYTEEDSQHSTLRAGVWQLPGKGKHARLVAGYREFDGNKETNEGSARIDLSRIWLSDCSEGGMDIDDMRDAALAADSLADRNAEEERDYQASYQAGREAAEMDAELIDTRRALLPLLVELRALRRGDLMLPPTVCKVMSDRLEAGLAAMNAAREAVRNAWSDCPSSREEAWLSGFMDESQGGFVRAVRLGFAKATDWKGAPEANPCNRKAAA